MPGPLLALALVTAGCTGPPALTAATGPAAIDAALAELAATAHGTETDVRRVVSDQTEGKSANDLETFRIEFEWGRAGQERIAARDLDPGGDGEAFDLELLCLGDREYLVAPNGTFEARRGTAWGCRWPGDPREPGLYGMLLFRRVGNVTIDEDGNAQAEVRRLHSPGRGEESRMLFVATVSPSGRLLALEGSEAGRLPRESVAVEYGNRRAMEAPSNVDDRASVAAKLSSPRTSQGSIQATLQGQPFPGAPRHEFTLRLERPGRPVAEVGLESEGPLQGDPGYRFSYIDRDGDGLLSVGDGLRIEGVGAEELALTLYDEWAGHPVGYTPYKIPAVGWLGVLAAVALAAAGRRRR